MDCLDPAKIEKYVTHNLHGQEFADIQEHLQQCPACRTAVGEAEKNEAMLSQLHTHHITAASDTLNPGDSASARIATVKQAQDMLGTQYNLVKKIGSGASGDVFLAVDSVLERPVAVKFLFSKASEVNPSDDAWHEGRSMSRVSHPHIAQIYQMNRQDNIRYIVMEWVEGVPLTQAWEQEPLQNKLRLYMQVLEAIDAAHKNGVVHRDIKPSNILVTAAGQVKVLDFGIALITGLDGPAPSRLYRGTPAYSAPEQITSPDRVGPATDVFALGVLLYELLTGRLPFMETDTPDLFDAICDRHPELPSAYRDGIPIALQNICLKAMEKNIENRYPDAHGLESDMRRFLQGEKVWARPTFIYDQIRQDIFYHRQHLDVWRKNDLITEREYDKLESIYDGVVEPSDPSIIESRRLSFSQICLYLGGWITVLGCAVLLSSQWSGVHQYIRPLPALCSVGLMYLCGRHLWVQKEVRLSVGFLVTGTLLLPVAALITLGHMNILNPQQYPLGDESVGVLPFSKIIIGNWQMLIAGGLWLLVSLALLRITKSSIFVIFGILAVLGLLSTGFLIAGMKIWTSDKIAGYYLFAGVGFYSLGVIFDRYRLSKYAWPLCAAGIVLLVTCLSCIALSENTLFGWLWSRNETAPTRYDKLLAFCFERAEVMKTVGLLCNGFAYLGLAWVSRYQNTRMQRILSQILSWIGSIHVLAALRVMDDLMQNETRQLICRICLPIASLGFIFSSSRRQLKSFFFGGLAGLAASVQKITAAYFEGYFSWPIILILIGVVCMLFSWWIPRLRVRQLLDHHRP